MTDIPLFERFPRIRNALPRLCLTDPPTAVEPAPALAKAAGVKALYVKRDDRTARPYGGNKVRKLEFLLARAKTDGCVRVMTVGAAGSNHAMATALYARQCGLKSALILFPQPGAEAVRENLLTDLYTDADLHPCEEYSSFRTLAEKLTRHYRELDGVAPMLIPAGGSSPLGVVGYVNAGLELASQVEARELEAPGAVYVALGTMGTAAGIAVGLRAAGMSVPVIGVRVVPTVVASEERLARLVDETVGLLRGYEPDFPPITAEQAGVVIEHEFFGGEYGRFTVEALSAAALMHDATGVRLDGVYTGKAFAALLAGARLRVGQRPVLFWDTKNSHPLPREALSLDYHALPQPLHHYFEDDVQQQPF